MGNAKAVVAVLSRILGWVAGWAMVVMMVLTCTDVVSRWFGKPVLGAFEVVGFLGSVTASLALAETVIERTHVAVDLFVGCFSAAVQRVVCVGVALLNLGLFGSLSLASFRYGRDLQAGGEVSMVLGVPPYPFVYGIGVAALLVCVVSAIDLLDVSTGRGAPWLRWRDQ